MKRLLSLAILLISCMLTEAQSGYNIPITLKPYKNTYVYLGYYYGRLKALADSTMLDENGKGVFSGKEPLPGGIYFIVSPHKEILFELLIDKQQQFSIAADSASLPNNVVFTGSQENKLFHLYTRFTNQIGNEINKTNTELKAAKTAKDSTKLKTRLKWLTDKMQLYRDSMVAKNSNSFLSALFQAMKEPVIPPGAKHPGGKYDSLFAYKYFKSHYWDGVSFDDGRLVRTPFFEAKLEKYYKELVVPNPDSIIAEVDHMLLYSRSSTEMFKFLMVHFVQKYINPEYMGQDAVFVHLFEKYINTGQADFFTQQYKDYTFKRAYSMMANLIGQPAAPLDLVDTLDKPAPLHNLKSNFVVICFWDPTCSHCKETVPKVDSIYKAKWKNEGVALYGVMVDGGKENWKKFINDNKLTGWTHAYQLPSQQKEEEAANKPNYRQLYDVYQTPILYLLDKDKNIIAKKLSYQQLDEVIDLKLKTKKSN
ncbi:MAG: redoxin domain-containing protein [Niastella sp.]|uniref:redoxin domain-containing protein n=1 Tax=Niastella sp. TaxID=1869183 RepID=UPI00389A38AF